MKTEKIDRLISALGNPTPKQIAPQESKAAAPQHTAENADAVKLAVGFGKGIIELGDPKESDRVLRLKAQVQNGTYQPKSEDVALALIRELGI